MPSRREAEIAEHQAPVGERVERDRDEDDDQRPARPLQRRDERAQHDIAVERQHRPLQRAHIDAGLLGQRRLLAHREQDRLGVPQQRPRSGSRPGRPATGPGARCGARRAPNGACGRARSPSSARSRASGRGRRSAARNRGWRRARRRPAHPRRAGPSSCTSVAVIAVWARLVRIIGQAQRQHRAHFVAPRIFRRLRAGIDRRHVLACPFAVRRSEEVFPGRKPFLLALEQINPAPGAGLLLQGAGKGKGLT